MVYKYNLVNESKVFLAAYNGLKWSDQELVDTYVLFNISEPVDLSETNSDFVEDLKEHFDKVEVNITQNTTVNHT